MTKQGTLPESSSARGKSRPYAIWLIVVVLVVALIGYAGGRRLRTHLSLLEQQERWLQYTAPADRIIYDSDPQESFRLVAAGEHDWIKTDALAGWSDGNIPAVYQHSDSVLARLNPVLLHGRRSPAGRYRLVVITIRAAPAYEQGPLTAVLVPMVGKVRTATQILSAPSRAFEVPFELKMPSGRLRLFAGQVDPQDASHFTIAYELNGRQGIIDGWLQDDDTVRLKFRE